MAGLQGRRKKKHRALCDLCACYGNVLGRVLTHEELFALWLLRERVRFQHAAGVAHGVSAALSKRNLPQAWFDALCDWPEQVESAAWEANAARSEARKLARAGRRG